MLGLLLVFAVCLYSLLALFALVGFALRKQNPLEWALRIAFPLTLSVFAGVLLGGIIGMVVWVPLHWLGLVGIREEGLKVLIPSVILTSILCFVLQLEGEVGYWNDERPSPWRKWWRRKRRKQLEALATQRLEGLITEVEYMEKQAALWRRRLQLGVLNRYATFTAALGTEANAFLEQVENIAALQHAVEMAGPLFTYSKDYHLQAFTNRVNAQRGKLLTPAQADNLIELAYLL